MLTLMKGDEVIEVHKQTANHSLLCLVGNWDLDLHHLPFRDVEARDSLGKHLDLASEGA